MTRRGGLRSLVVDDELLARRNLTALLRQDPDFASVDECASGAEAIVEIRRSRPDVVFLDVQMPEYDGFDVLEHLGADQPPAIVFVTAHDAHALRAFEAGALDYLLKPFTNARFTRVLERAKERLFRAGNATPLSIDTLIVKCGREFLFVKAADIDWIEAANYYACIHAGSATHIVRRSLAVLEQELGPDTFCRIHRSTIVNVDRVQRLEHREDGEYTVVLRSSARLQLSRRFRKALLQRLERR